MATTKLTMVYYKLNQKNIVKPWQPQIKPWFTTIINQKNIVKAWQPQINHGFTTN